MVSAPSQGWCEEVIAEDEAIIENIVIGDPVWRMVAESGIFEEDTRFQARDAYLIASATTDQHIQKDRLYFQKISFVKSISSVYDPIYRYGTQLMTEGIAIIYKPTASLRNLDNGAHTKLWSLLSEGDYQNQFKVIEGNDDNAGSDQPLLMTSHFTGKGAQISFDHITNTIIPFHSFSRLDA